MWPSSSHLMSKNCELTRNRMREDPTQIEHAHQEEDNSKRLATGRHGSPESGGAGQPGSHQSV